MQLLNYKTIEQRLGIRFKKKRLLKLALTHSSYLQTQSNMDKKSNERLEFLGDAVLELITREYLLTKLPEAHEGDLSELKKMYTSTEALHKIGKKLGLGKFVLMNKGEERTGGRTRPSNIAGCTEAIIGALYLDRGLKYTRRFVERNFFGKKIVGRKDYKSILNKWAMKNKAQFYYKTVKEKGPPHRKTFYVGLFVNKKKAGYGTGKTKKKAEQEAAKNFLRKNSKLRMPNFK